MVSFGHLAEIKTAIIVRAPMCFELVDGSKTWEIRSRMCRKHVGSWIGIQKARTGTIIGEVNFAESRQLQAADLDEPAHQRKHCLTAEWVHTAKFDRKTGKSKRVVAWIVEGARRYPVPVPCDKKAGVVCWPSLDKDLCFRFNRRRLLESVGIGVAPKRPAQRLVKKPALKRRPAVRKADHGAIGLPAGEEVVAARPDRRWNRLTLPPYPCNHCNWGYSHTQHLDRSGVCDCGHLIDNRADVGEVVEA